MGKYELKNRTTKFALNITRLVSQLPETNDDHTIRNQIIWSGTSVVANYRSACRERSNADFAARINLIEEESDKTKFWLELIIHDANLL
jgi:four helix bundle protein